MTDTYNRREFADMGLGQSDLKAITIEDIGA
jgi:hypothetical protein